MSHEPQIPLTREEALRQDRQRIMALVQRNPDVLEVATSNGSAPEKYSVVLRCKGVRLRRSGEIRPIEEHHVEIHLGPEYPSKPPVLVWTTPFFHPNVLGSSVCLLVNRWKESYRLDQVCQWLWDTARFALMNVSQPLNNPARDWVLEQPEGTFPLDARTLVPAVPTPAADQITRRITIRWKSEADS